MVGCLCPVCHSTDSRNRRRRASVLLLEGQTSVLIDAGPDFRIQALEQGLHHLDAVVLTHAHADHILGLDDLRPLSWERGIPIASDAGTLKQVRRIFPYFFSQVPGKSSRPRVSLEVLKPGKERTWGELTVLPLAIQHGDDTILGFRCGPVAYLTDCNGIPGETLERLSDLEVLILGALRYKPHPTHFHLATALEMAARVGARRTILTHLSHDFDHDVLAAELPPGIAPAYDGLVLEF